MNFEYDQKAEDKDSKKILTKQYQTQATDSSIQLEDSLKLELQNDFSIKLDMQDLTQGQGSQGKSSKDKYDVLDHDNDCSPTGKGAIQETQNIGNFLMDEQPRKRGFDGNTTQTNALLNIEEDQFNLFL